VSYIQVVLWSLVQASENVGMIMIFTLVSGAQDKLSDILDTLAKEKERMLKEKEEELKRIEEVCSPDLNA
jgi:hypothetical protein